MRILNVGANIISNKISNQSYKINKYAKILFLGDPTYIKKYKVTHGKILFA